MAQSFVSERKMLSPGISTLFVLEFEQSAKHVKQCLGLVALCLLERYRLQRNLHVCKVE